MRFTASGDESKWEVSKDAPFHVHAWRVWGLAAAPSVPSSHQYARSRSQPPGRTVTCPAASKSDGDHVKDNPPSAVTSTVAGERDGGADLVSTVRCCVCASKHAAHWQLSLYHNGTATMGVRQWWVRHHTQPQPQPQPQPHIPKPERVERAATSIGPFDAHTTCAIGSSVTLHNHSASFYYGRCAVTAVGGAADGDASRTHGRGFRDCLRRSHRAAAHKRRCAGDGGCSVPPRATYPRRTAGRAESHTPEHFWLTGSAPRAAKCRARGGMHFSWASGEPTVVR